jgi:hypothetical protein
MMKANGILIWVLAALGLLLVYAAYKGQSPKLLLTSVLSTTTK